MTCIHHVSTAHVETTSKIKLMIASTTNFRVKDLEKENESFYTAEGKIHQTLKMTRSEIHTSYSKNSIEAEHDHTLRNKKFEEKLRKLLCACHN